MCCPPFTTLYPSSQTLPLHAMATTARVCGEHYRAPLLRSAGLQRRVSQFAGDPHCPLCSDGEEALCCGCKPRMKPLIQPFSSVSTGLMPTSASARGLASGVLPASCSSAIFQRNALLLSYFVRRLRTAEPHTAAFAVPPSAITHKAWHQGLVHMLHS